MSGSLVASILTGATVTVALALAASWWARTSRAAVRHVLLVAAFAVLLVLPLASIAVHAIGLRVQVSAPTVVTNAVASIAEVIEFPMEDPPARAAVASPTSRSASLPLFELLFALWATGGALYLLPVVIGLWQVRWLRHGAVPWRGGQTLVEAVSRTAATRRHVDVVLHDAVPGPMTCGVVRPAIVMPGDTETWADEDLKRAIVHELEHVRRADWLTQTLARMICACYWFHPLVWIARRRLVLEAERACDDAVLRHFSTSLDTAGDATAYADQLVALAKRLSATPHPPLLAMASRGDLTTRIRALLDRRQARGRAGTIAVTAACALAAAIVMTISPLRIVAADQSGQPVTRFEVASIKACQENDLPPQTTGARQGGSGPVTVSPGRLSIQCVTAERLIAMAYVTNAEPLLNNLPVNGREEQFQWIKQSPGWARTEKFTVEAKAETAVERKVLLGPMLQALLEDRFKLKLHRDQEEMPMYALTVAKGGLKMEPLGSDGCVKLDTNKPTGPDMAYAQGVMNGTTKPMCGVMTMLTGSTPGSRRWMIGGTTLTEFARTITGTVGRPVLDQTGVTGEFNVRIEFTPDERSNEFARAGRDGGVPPDPSGPTMFKALEDQLGLKLEPTKGFRGFLVIDRLERPAPNSGS